MYRDITRMEDYMPPEIVNTNVVDNTIQSEAVPQAQTELNADNVTENKKTFSQEDINRIVAKESSKTERSIFSMLGIKDKSELENIVKSLSEYKLEQDSKMTITQRYESQTLAMQELQNKYNELNNNYTAKEQEFVLKNYDIPEKMRDYYKNKILNYSKENNISFEESAKKYIEIDPLPAKPEKVPATLIPGITGNTTLNAPEIDEFQKRILKYKK